MIVNVKCKSLHACCKCCGAVYELNKPKDFRKVKWNKNPYWESEGVLKCRCCKQRIFVKGAK